ncbi:MAG: hypothetical protein AAF411_16965 [Myxococcota bacterium]
MSIDIETAYASYVARFEDRLGPKPAGAFAKFGKTMIQRLTREDFPPKLENYLHWHSECKRLLGSGATISDALVLEFEEASAWLAIDPPNILELFSGELGVPEKVVTSPNDPKKTVQ